MNHANSLKRCSHLSLLRSDGLNIEYCSECAVVHIELECVSIKFRRDAFAGLAVALSHAEANLEAIERGDEYLAWLQRAGRPGASDGVN